MQDDTTRREALQEAQRLMHRVQEGGPDAVEAGLRAADIVREALGQNHPAVAGVLCSTSSACYARRHYDKAEKLVREAMNIWKAQPGPERPEIALCLNNLGRIEEERGNLQEGVRLHREAVALRQRLLGDHPDTAFSLTNLGAALTEAAQWSEAAETLEAALACYQRLGLNDETAVDACRQNLALCRERLGRNT